MVLFLKGCSTETVGDGGHQEGKVQAGWEQCLRFCSLNIFLHVLKKFVMTRKILQLGELQLLVKYMFLRALVVVHGQKLSGKLGAL